MSRNQFITSLGAFSFLAMTGVNVAVADTTWISTSSTAFITVGNWNNGLPSTGPQGAIFADSATIQHTIDVTGATARNTIGITFNAFTGGAGFTFGSSANNSPGFQTRAGGVANGIVNNDGNTQTFNLSITLFSNTGIAGALAAQTFNAAGGDLIFSGNHSNLRSTLNNNGGTLTVDGAHNTTIGSSGATFGDIVGSGGLIKNGAGTLTLGGSTANSYTGGNVINQGTVTAAKANALGNGNTLKMTGGTFQTGGLNQALNTLDLAGSATLDLGSGTSALSFANSSALNWAGNALSIYNFTFGTDTIRFGTDATGLTQAQLDDIVFADLGNAHAQIDSSGFLSVAPVPEPSTIAIGALGGIGLLLGYRRKTSLK